MKFIISSKDLDHMGLTLSKYAVNKASDGYGLVRIVARNGQATFTTSNPQQTVSVMYMVDKCVNGEAIIEANKFLKLSRTFSDLVSFEIKNQQLHLKHSGSSYKMALASDIIFTELAILSTTPVSVDLSDITGRIGYGLDTAMSNALAFFWFNNDGIAASNGAVLAEGTFSAQTGIVACIPPIAIKDIRGKCNLRFGQGQLDLFYGNFYISTRIAEFTFPPYRSIIPSYEDKITVNRKELLSILNRVSIFASADSRVNITISGNELSIGTNSDVSEVNESISGESNRGSGVTVCLHISYLISALGALGGDTLEIYFGGSDQAVLFKNPERADLTTVIMPMR